MSTLFGWVRGRRGGRRPGRDDAADLARLDDLCGRMMAFRLSCCFERLKRAGRFTEPRGPGLWGFNPVQDPRQGCPPGAKAALLFPGTDPFTAFEAVDSMTSNQTAARLVGAPL